MPCSTGAVRMLACALLVWAMSATLWAARPLLLDPAMDRVTLGPHLDLLWDASGEMNHEQARASTDWQTLGARSPTFGFTSQALWLRARIHNTDHPQTRWALVLRYALLDDVRLYIRYRDGRSEQRVGGDLQPFAARDIKHRHPNFLLDLQTGDQIELLMRVRSDSSMQVPLALMTPEAFLAETHETQLGIGLYFGLLSALFLYNLIIFIGLRDPSYGWYVLYVGGFGIVVLCLNGLAFEYLWPRSPGLANAAVPISMAFGLLAMAQFASSFLDLRTHMPRVKRLFEIFAVSQLLMMPAGALLPYRIAIQIETAAVFVIAALIAITAIRRVLDGDRPARVFLIAWSFVLLGTVIYAMVSFGLLPKMFLTEYGIQIGSAMEMILLSYALAFRIRKLEQVNERMAREAAEALERRVDERTRELNSAMGALESLNQQLQEFSLRDGLTGVYNRRYLDQALQTLWQQCAQTAQPLSVLMIDIDHFKQINDRHGHLIGDDCLRTVADCLSSHLQHADELLARWGGEEFIIVLPKVHAVSAMQRAEQIRSAVEALSDSTPGITLSIGVASVLPGSDQSIDALVGEADQALYAAKHAGRNRVSAA